MRITLVVILLLLLCGVGVCAESQPPTPSRGELSSQKQENASHINNTPYDLKQSPAPLNVALVPTRNTEPQITKNQKENKSPSEWWLIGLTAVLALATYRLVVQTRRLVNETTIASKRQAVETKDALELSQRAAAAAEKAAELAQISFLATNRPKIILRDAYCTSVECGDPIEVHYVLANTGESDGTIVGSVLNINKYLSDSGFGAYVLPNADDGTNEIGETILQPGEQRTFSFTSNTLKWQSYNSTRLDSQEENIGVFFSGHIVYKDARGVVRNMAFHRRHKIGPERFFKVEDKYISALEYE